jgi:hypothetical protein
MYLKLGFWTDREYHLDKMNLSQLTAAYFQYYAIAAYLFVAFLLSLFICYSLVTMNISLSSFALSFFVPIIIYPMVWYALHRWVLHSRWMWKSKITAPIWKRIHYDHHADPNNLKVLFGALYTTLPTVVIATVPFGFYFGDIQGAATALCVGILTTCFYEFIHCIEHLGYMPKSRWLRELKRLHMAHHFHNETGNFGITNFFCDWLLGTMYQKNKQKPRSETVFNLGYDEDVALKYPYVAKLTPEWPHTADPVKRQKFYNKNDKDELVTSIPNF